MDPKRLILFVIFSFSILMLWEAWQRDNTLQPQSTPSSQTAQQEGAAPAAVTTPAQAQPDTAQVAQRGERIHVRTDFLSVELDTLGGDLRRVELLQHKQDEDKTRNFVLLEDNRPGAIYVAQSGLIGQGMPTHKSLFQSEAREYQLAEGQDKLEVTLRWRDASGVEVDKIYRFDRSSYLVQVSHRIRNNSTAEVDPSVYYQIVHDNQSNKSSFMMPTYTGAAYFTEAEKYKKVSFDDMKKSNLSMNANNGWIGLVQHYFVSAWIPAQGTAREYFTKQISENIFSMGLVSGLGKLATGAETQVGANYYVGPQDQQHLKAVAPGLEYTVDYGWLTVIAAPLFWVLSMIQKLVHNWGVAIILLTVLIKLAFYPLSAASYRSMAQMRELAPRLQRMKEQYGDDRQKLHQAMMELYKTEKINPMGGCLPILIQIPVFIALYWVLLGSVEMRHAPFMLWIQDLSAVDPYYVLPILMGLTMIIQTHLNPTPPDPIQARVMKIMPVVFSVFFFFFPAGLVLYWLVNNVLSIAQQWHINRTIGQHKKGLAKA